MEHTFPFWPSRVSMLHLERADLKIWNFNNISRIPELQPWVSFVMVSEILDKCAFYYNFVSGTHRVGRINIDVGLEMLQHLVQMSSPSGSKEGGVPIGLQQRLWHQYLITPRGPRLTNICDENVSISADLRTNA